MCKKLGQIGQILRHKTRNLDYRVSNAMPVHVKVIAVPYLGEVITLTRVGNMVLANGNMKFTQSGQQNYSTANETIPVGYRPTNVKTPIVCGSVNFSLLVYAV